MWKEIVRKGRQNIPYLMEYKLNTTLDPPDIETILVEIPDREGPFGAKEAGQGPLNPVIPAIANAVYDAVGVRIDEVPITSDKVFRALKNLAQGKGTELQPTPIELSSPWPTRLISWQRNGSQGEDQSKASHVHVQGGVS